MKKNIIWHIHIPKTGGTSINTFAKQSHLKNTEIYCFDHDNYTKSIEDELLKKGNLYKVTILRDPISHCRSFYTYIKKDSSHHLHEKVLSMSFSNWIRQYTRLENFYVNFFDPKKADVDNVVKILNDFIILRTENLTAEFNILLNNIGEDSYFDVHNNASEELSVSQNDVNFIKKIRDKDFELLKKLNL